MAAIEPLSCKLSRVYASRPDKTLMPKQLNVCSGEADQIAHDPAQPNRTQAEFLEKALREDRKPQTADELTLVQAVFLADIQALSARAAVAAARPGANSDHHDFYDKKGLPA